MSDRRRDLVVALRALPRRQREAVALRYLADLPEADAAAAMGCSLGTVKSATSRGLERLRVELGSQWAWED
jgi:RNA polymerase sigma factor (sigma-70 family)